jgi:hypothetical protein
MEGNSNILLSESKTGRALYWKWGWGVAQWQSVCFLPVTLGGGGGKGRKKIKRKRNGQKSSLMGKGEGRHAFLALKTKVAD